MSIKYLQRVSPTVADSTVTNVPMVKMVADKGGDFIVAEGVRIFIEQNRNRDPNEVLEDILKALSL